MGIETLEAAGISYGRDLAVTYPVFSRRVDTIYASGTLGSFSAVQPALAELRAICRSFGAEEQVTLSVTPDRGHEMDNEDLCRFLST